jgi:hypothetical protein
MHPSDDTTAAPKIEQLIARDHEEPNSAAVCDSTLSLPCSGWSSQHLPETRIAFSRLGIVDIHHYTDLPLALLCTSIERNHRNATG